MPPPVVYTGYYIVESQRHGFWDFGNSKHAAVSFAGNIRVHMPRFAAEIIRTHEYFVCLWNELNQLFQILERRSSALLIGARQSGRSSLLYTLYMPPGRCWMTMSCVPTTSTSLFSPTKWRSVSPSPLPLANNQRTGNVASSNTARHRYWRLILVISRNWPKRLIVGGKLLRASQ